MDKIKLLEKAGPVIQIGKIYVQLTGLSVEKAKEILKIAAPEA